MLEAGDEKALSKVLDLLSYDTDVAQETKENVLLNLRLRTWAVFLNVHWFALIDN